MRVLFRIRIAGEVHEVRVEVPQGQSPENLESLKESVVTMAWLEHFGRLPKGVINSFD